MIAQPTTGGTNVRPSFANAPLSGPQNGGGGAYTNGWGGYGNTNYNGYGYGGYGNGYGYGGYGNGYGGGFSFSLFGSLFGGGYGYPYNSFGGGYGYPYNSFRGGYGYPYNWLGSAYGGGYPQTFFSYSSPYDMTDPQIYGDPAGIPQGDPVPLVAQVFDSQLAPAAETGMKIVESIDGAAARAADLRANDIILAVGNQRVRTFAELQSALAQTNGETAIVFINAESGKTEKLFITPVAGKIGVAVVPVDLK